MVNITRIIRLLFFIAGISSISLNLCACFCTNCPPVKSKLPCADLIESLQDQGVQVIQRGDTLRIILSSDNFFEPASTKIIPERVAVLTEVAALTNCHCYLYAPIRVYGYSDNANITRDQKQRSYQQAHSIAALLWANGIPLHRIYQIRGFGAHGSIASNETPLGSAYNRRVEILLP